ncbi:MAG: hypothetical protein V1659_00900, partial [Candidatus Woesearchaeota archaeon]
MQVKIKKENQDGVVRLETSGLIKEVLINENMFNPSEESVAVCFRGKNSSGIVKFTTKEIESICSTVKNR